MRRSRTFLTAMKKLLPFAIIIVVLGAAAGLALVLLKSKGTSNSNTTFVTSGSTAGASPAANQLPPATAGATRPNVKVSSPVVVEEYGDYQCPPCGLLYPDLKQIEHEYGNQVQVVFRHFPLM